jgi:hypothetical protein
MHFDDRLATVLRLPTTGDALARIQYRQLVDLLGRLPDDAHSEMIEAGLARIAELGDRIPARDRARLLRQPLQPITNPRLVALLAAAEPDAASAAIASARLDEAQWLKLIPELPVRARGILRHRRDLEPRVEALLERLGIGDRGLPPAPNAVAPVERAAAAAPENVFELTPEAMMQPEAAARKAKSGAVPIRPDKGVEWARAAVAFKAEKLGQTGAGIGAIVRRIEEFRKARETHTGPEPANDAPRLPLGDVAATAARGADAIDFETDQEGRITWADSSFAPALVGLNLTIHECPAEGAASAGHAADIATAIRYRLPLRATRVRISGAPAIHGDWQVDAIARFDTQGGRFLGYCGRMRRPARGAAPDARVRRDLSEADRMRQILHELRTPANAIQVAAEIIQQQLYGPAPHEYRALAAAIAGDCAHILAGFEELDRLVKLESGALQIEPGDCDLATILLETVSRLKAWTDPRRSGFDLPPEIEATALPVQMDRTEAERLVWRLLAALAGATAPDEILELSWTHDANDGIALRIGLPATLAAREESELFETAPGERGQPLSAGMFGLGFTLRLAAAEAAAAGGMLQRDGKVMRLDLPGLTAAAARHSTAVNHSH